MLTVLIIGASDCGNDIQCITLPGHQQIESTLAWHVAQRELRLIS
jgi:hypothetical protein